MNIKDILTSIDFRLQEYKYFKLEQLLQELKPTLKDRHGDGEGLLVL